jgi:hypothetical protein
MPVTRDPQNSAVEKELRCEMALLRELRIIKRLAGMLEIGAAVLAVRVEEKTIEMRAEVVMMRDVAPRAPARIELLNASCDEAREPARVCPEQGAALLTEQDGKHVRDRAALDHDLAIHVSFSKTELGVDEEAELRAPRHKPHCSGLPGPVSERECRPARGGHPKITRTDEPDETCTKQPLHRSHRLLSLHCHARDTIRVHRQRLTTFSHKQLSADAIKTNSFTQGNVNEAPDQMCRRKAQDDPVFAPKYG